MNQKRANQRCLAHFPLLACEIGKHKILLDLFSEIGPLSPLSKVLFSDAKLNNCYIYFVSIQYFSIKFWLYSNPTVQLNLDIL